MLKTPRLDSQAQELQTAQVHGRDPGTGIPAPENKRFYPALDGLRAVAVLMVFYRHYLGGRHLWLNWGWTGVDFFFVLSGFLITGILYDTRNSANRFRTFYMRRTLRIFPLYYGVLIFCFLLTPAFHWRLHPAWLLWPLYLGNYARYLWIADWHNPALASTMDRMYSSVAFHPPFSLYFSHFWSLCVEEQFYLVWPPLVFLIRDRVRLRNFCLVACVLCLAARIACVYLLPATYLQAEILYRLTPLRADALLLGGAIALMLRGPESDRLRSLARPALLLFVTGFVLFEVLYRQSAHHLYFPPDYPPDYGAVLDTLGFTLIDLFAAIVILLSLRSGGTVYRIFTITPLRRLGQVSYGFYVFHDIPHMAYERFADHTIGRYSGGHASGFWVAMIALCGTLALSFFSFRYFETPFLRLKERFTV